MNLGGDQHARAQGEFASIGRGQHLAVERHQCAIRQLGLLLLLGVAGIGSDQRHLTFKQSVLLKRVGSDFDLSFLPDGDETDIVVGQ